MNKEKTDKLLNDFPLLYLNKSIKKSLMCFGFECGDGWYNIIYELSKKINDIIEKMPEEDRPYVFQVKEKFGTLRFYMSSETKEMSELINEYEKRSSFICETCGSYGELRKYGWLRTLCNKCNKK